ncbi:protein of unknown function [Candidatus Filomicrobium marinum]|uniref:Uncharacterized protein n=1 Tax=Candidatus Filomicrobium marinum TaxID=1608628 RepID=A0A0D6JBE0_9HYPH|nr:protein of unknown function [Candidatus Filomicrobium marinum]
MMRPAWALARDARIINTGIIRDK